MTISIEHVRLEVLQNDHASALFQQIDSNRASLREWLPWPDLHKTIEDTYDFIRRSAEQLESRNGLNLGLWTGGELAGVAGFHYIDWTDKATSVGFWLAPKFEGHGLMTRAVFGLMYMAFESYNLTRVEGRAAAGNARSRALFERLGFREEGVVRKAQILPNGWVDHILYSVVDEDWPEIRGKWPVSIEIDS